MHKKKIGCAIVIAGLVALSHTVNATPQQLRFSHVVSENTPKGKVANMLKTLIGEQLGDKFYLTVYPNSDLYDDKAVFKALQLGDVHFAAPSLSKFGRYTDKLMIYDLPFIFENIEAAQCFANKSNGGRLFKRFEQAGFKLLALLPNGLRQISSKEPIYIPEDLNGKRYRIESSSVFLKNIQALNGVPMKTTWEEALNSIRFGVIDAWENSWSNLYTSDAYRHFPYITELNHDLQGYGLITSTAFWNGLTKSEQAKMNRIIEQVSQQWIALAHQEANEMMQRLKSIDQVTVIKPTDAQIRRWIDALKPTWAHFEEKIGKDNIDAAIACNSDAYQKILRNESP